MARRYPNPGAVKLHRSYTVRELGRAIGKHPNTIRNWLTDGLRGFKDGRQTLILGEAARQFLKAKRSAAKQPCPAGHLYCFSCRKPRLPALQELDLTTTDDGRLVLTGLCECCTGTMKQSVSKRRLALFRQLAMVKEPLLPIRL